MLMHALAASCEELRARTGNPPLHYSKFVSKPILKKKVLTKCHSEVSEIVTTGPRTIMLRDCKLSKTSINVSCHSERWYLVYVANMATF